jgi:hypothetical protein
MIAKKTNPSTPKPIPRAAANLRHLNLAVFVISSAPMMPQARC